MVVVGVPRHSDGDGDLASCTAGIEVAHGVRDPSEWVGAVDARRERAGLDELGEPLQVGRASCRERV